MAINLKAKETLIQVGELKGKYRFVLGTELYSKLSESKVIKEAARRSGVSRGVMPRGDQGVGHRRPLRSYSWFGNHEIRRESQERGNRDGGG